jgi:activator of 2-hydroxyglutaryl-CoA dehydratase
MRCAGIDIGSRTIEVVVLEEALGAALLAKQIP